MSSFPWNLDSTKKKSITADIGDIHLILKKNDIRWTLDMGIRVYNNDHSRSMVRPPATVAYFDASYTQEEAMEQAETYFKNFFSTITSSLE